MKRYRSVSLSSEIQLCGCFITWLIVTSLNTTAANTIDSFLGESHSISCDRLPGIPLNVAPIWLHNDTAIDTNNRNKYSITSGGLTLAIRNVTLLDEGVYRCQYGMNVHTPEASIYIVGKPAFEDCKLPTVCEEYLCGNIGDNFNHELKIAYTDIGVTQRNAPDVILTLKFNDRQIVECSSSQPCAIQPGFETIISISGQLSSSMDITFRNVNRSNTGIYTATLTARGMEHTKKNITIAACSILTQPLNGLVTVSNCSASYECNDGHNLTGSGSRQCQSTSIWSGSEPTCTRVPDEPTTSPMPVTITTTEQIDVTSTTGGPTSARVGADIPIGVVVALVLLVLGVTGLVVIIVLLVRRSRRAVQKAKGDSSATLSVVTSNQGAFNVNGPNEPNDDRSECSASKLTDQMTGQSTEPAAAIEGENDALGPYNGYRARPTAIANRPAYRTSSAIEGEKLHFNGAFSSRSRNV